MKKNQNILVTLFAITAVIVVFAFVNFGHKPHKEIESEFPVTTPWRENVDIKKEYVAQIKAIQHIDIRSLEKGYLQNTYVDEGQFVKKDQKMFQIMPLLVEAELKKAKAEFELAKIEYDNSLILKKRGIVSANELALSKARLDKAQAEMDLAQAHLNLTTIKAPFDGIVDRFHVRLGSLVDEGELLTNLSDNSKMWVYFNVSEADYLDYMQNKDKNAEVVAELELANGSLFSNKGIVDTIEADFNNEFGNVAFRATFDNPDGLLRHGETGTILLNKRLENALIIPQKSTYEVLDKKFVYVVDEKNEVHSQEITVVEELPHLFIISEGVDDDDTILLEGLGKIHDGDEIKTYTQSHELVKQNLDLSTGKPI